jgi:hypothetical protein
MGQNVKMRGLSRHFEGYQLAVVSVGIALCFALLAVPRPVAPTAPLLPEIDRREQARSRALEQRLAERAYGRALPYDVRAVGEQLRRYGTAVNHGAAGAEEIAELRRQVRSARAAHGDEPLLELRAVQTQLFLSALRRWEGTGRTSTDLEELSGDFLDKVTQSGWIDARGRLVATEDERVVLFRMRFGELAGIRSEHPFSPSLNEWRTYYRFLIKYPELRRDAAARELDARRLEYVTALAKRDPDYPVALARGVLELRRGAYHSAVEALREHLARHPAGPWRLRAQNYLAAALESAPPMPDE